QLHGGLLDAQILGDVYIALTSGQEEIGFGSADDVRPGTAHAQAFDTSRLLPRPRVGATASEREAHEARLAKLRKKAGHAIWDGPKVEESAA
ncbi:DNA polymerase III subunit epsilon, partial [Staphylococcus hominis]